MLSFKVHRVWDGVHTARQTNDPKPIFYDKTQKKRVKLRDPHSNIDCKFQPKSSCLHDSQTVYMPFLWPWSLRFFVVVTQRARERLLKRISRKSPHKSKTRKNLYLFAKAKFTVYHISYWRKKSEWGGHAIMWKKAQKNEKLANK